MVQKVYMPKLGQTMEEGVIEKWLVKEGDAVKTGDILLEITTDKATLEVETYQSGYVKKILVAEKETVPVNAIIALLGEQDEEVTPELLESIKAEASSTAAAPQEKEKPADKETAPLPTPPEAKPATAKAPESSTTLQVARGGRIFASPRAKKIARELEIPIAVLTGSGPNGRIVERDVRAYEEKAKSVKITPLAKRLAFERGVDITKVTGSGPDGKITKEDIAQVKIEVAAQRGEIIEPSAMRKIIAERMTQSKQQIPHYYLSMNVDMGPVKKLREQILRETEEKISFNVFVVKAVALAIAKHPMVNASWQDGKIVRKGAINVGIAVALDDGLIVPVLKNADTLSLSEIARQTKVLAEKARSKKLTPDEYSGGSITLSNLGMYEIDSFIPVINPGESVILGISRIADTVVVEEGGIKIKSMMNITLSGDHRVVDGAQGAQFLREIKYILQEPSTL